MNPSHPIMVVDDDDDIRDILAMMLRGEGFPIVTAADGAAALASLRSGTRPSLILLDLRMPRVSGYEVLETLKSEDGFAAIPVVVMSGDSSARAVASSLGADACLEKPVEYDDVLALAHRFA
ncbi:MAG: response regulator [Polyangiales bacterium]